MSLFAAIGDQKPLDTLNRSPFLKKKSIQSSETMGGLGGA
jgi:hypothetical protein